MKTFDLRSLYDSLIKTNLEYGLEDEHVLKAIRILKKYVKINREN